MPTENRRVNAIRPDEILDLGEYERTRDAARQSAIAARSLRRLELGPNATLSFENRETVRYQIQEMLRAERLAKPEEVLHEIETYSDLLPGPLELSATLMLEFPEEGRSATLAALVGIEDHLRLDFEGAGSAAAHFDRRQLSEEKVSAVQFVRFPLTAAQREAMGAARSVTAVTDHPGYSHSVRLRPELVSALAADLAES